MASKLLFGGQIIPGVSSLTATKSTTTPKSINLSWTAAIGTFTTYKLFRGSTEIVSTTNTSYSDTGLGYNTQYTYTVYAYNNTVALPQSATATQTTYVQCTTQSGYFAGNAAGGANASTTVTLNPGCFKIRIRALSSGGGGYAPATAVHQGSCYGPYGGGGGGAYIDGTASYAPGSQVVVEVQPAALAGYDGGGAGIQNVCWVSGGKAGSGSAGAGGTATYAPAGATYTSGSSGSYDTTAGGAAALAGTNPTGLYTHGGAKAQGCSRCAGCTGSTGNAYGGGGTNGTDSSTLWGESRFRGGDGANGYVVWSTSET